METSPASTLTPATPSPPINSASTQQRHDHCLSLTTLLRRYERQALWTVVLVGLLLRVSFLERMPNNVTADELDFSTDILQILHGQGPGFFGLDWASLPAFDIYFMSWSWQVFGANLFAERLVSAIITTLAIPLFYPLVRRHVSVPAALAATMLFASSRWFLLFSRSGWPNADLITFTVVAAYFVFRALERPKSLLDWCGVGAGMALLLYGYSAGRAVVLAFATYLLLAFLASLRDGETDRWRSMAVGTTVAVIVCLALIGPELVTISKQLPDFNRRTSAVYIFSEPLKAGQTWASVLASQTWTTFRSFFLMDTSTGAGRYKGPHQGWLDPVSAGLYMAGMVLALYRRRGFALWWCLLVIPLAITQVFTRDIPNGARSIAAVTPMYVFAAFSIDAVLVLGRAIANRLVLLVCVVAIGGAAYNVVTYVQWQESPEALLARQPAVPSAGFATWRDFQAARLANNQHVMNAGDYNRQTPAAIMATIATLPSLFTSPPAPDARAGARGS